MNNGYLESIEKDIMAIEQIPEDVLTDALKESIIRIAINKNYVLNYYSPSFLKRNVELCMHSYKMNHESIKHFDWNYFSDYSKDRNLLIEFLIKENYVLDSMSPELLRNNPSICLNSIKTLLSSANFFGKRINYWLKGNINEYPLEDEKDKQVRRQLYEIRNYLIEKDFYSLEQMQSFAVSSLNDENVLKHLLEKLEYSEKDTVYIERIKDFIKTFLSQPVKIANFQKVFQLVAEKEWEAYRNNNQDYYTNLFNRICSALEKHRNLERALEELRFLIKADSIFEEKKYLLYNALTEYHRIYYDSNISNKKALLQVKKNEISQFAALFISKSKEEFVKKTIDKLNNNYKSLFKLRLDNSIVKKKIIEVKQREILKKLFEDKDSSLMKKIELIKNKYLSLVNRDNVIGLFIVMIITQNISNIDELLSDIKPKRFDEYEIYESVSKIINRLNSHYIEFNSLEASKYHDFILFDGNKYKYCGNTFNDLELIEIKEYQKLKYVFGKIRMEIMQISKDIEEIDDITKDDLEKVIKECPFNDEYYEFDSKLFNRYSIKNIMPYLRLFDDEKDLIRKDQNYYILQELGNRANLLQLFMASELSYLRPNYNALNIDSFVGSSELTNIFGNIPALINLLDANELKVDNLDKIIDYNNLLKSIDLGKIFVLGKNVVKKIYFNKGFTSVSDTYRVASACDLAYAMIGRDTSTVPYVDGRYKNYHYSIFDGNDTNLLTCGIDTNNCFRIGGNDNDFLHYCALNKNGFILKIENSEGQLIAKASGFRNGNGVYINQLKTIYDKVASAYHSEKDEIVETFKKACQDIVEISQENAEEQEKIDFVVVNQSGLLKNMESNVGEMTSNIIGTFPVNVYSDDWKDFRKYPNLTEANKKDFFTTDYGDNPLICVASSLELTPRTIKKGNVLAVYQRKRKEVKIENSSDEIEENINHIRACYAYEKKEEFNYQKLLDSCQVVTGDNWYIILKDGKIRDYCYLEIDKYAKIECEEVLERLKRENKEEIRRTI